MTDQPRHADNDSIDEALEPETLSQSGSSGGNLARDVGEQDELAAVTAKDSSITHVRKGDEPTLPNG